jgi:chromosome segregation protein
MALVFAMLRVKPTPFCILDEIDAPLDESNVERFAQVLRQLADQTQFLVITHNKGTMAQADSLIGVTMQDPGISMRLSVTLQEAQDLADQQIPRPVVQRELDLR